jgi:hypothetical protein
MSTVKRKGVLQKALICNLISPIGTRSSLESRINPRAGVGIGKFKDVPPLAAPAML